MGHLACLVFQEAKFGCSYSETESLQNGEVSDESHSYSVAFIHSRMNLLIPQISTLYFLYPKHFSRV